MSSVEIINFSGFGIVRHGSYDWLQIEEGGTSWSIVRLIYHFLLIETR